MRTPLHLELAAIVLATMALIAAGCTATETVIVSESAAAGATSTARSAAPTPLPPADAGEPDADEPSTSPADTADPPDAATPGPVTVGGTSAEDCRFVEIDDFGDIQVELDFVADAISEQDDTSVNYVLFDGTGAEIAQSRTLIEDLKPGERVRIALDTLQDEPSSSAAANGITCEIVDFSSFGFGPDPIRPRADDVCRFLELDPFGDIQVEVDVANPLAETTDLAIDYALRGPDGTRFGDGIVFTEDLGPGARFTETDDTLTDLPNWLTESEVRCEILAIEDF